MWYSGSMTTREQHTYWTEVKRVIAGEVIQTTCCCAAAGKGRRDCMTAQGNKTPCRCACHGHKTKSGVRFRQLDAAK